MAEVTVSVPPGYYGGAQTVVVTFPPGVRKAIITQGDVSPVLSEVLAFDQGPLYPNAPPHTGVPPGDIVARPFLAVTQDGRGNVVYDAGFPKYYNATMPVPRPTAFATLTPAMKYMYNAVNFIAKPNVPKKILVVGNTKNGVHYDVKSFLAQGGPTSSQGFLDTFNLVLPLAGYTFDILNVSDFPGTNQLEGTVALFEQYCCVIVMCGHYSTAAESFISDQFASELASYRAGGGGVFVITDHLERIYNSLADATANSVGFGKDANKVTKYYGTYFSGNVDRAPVLVSEIKRQLALNGGPGNHPLLANLADSESISSGGSESLVMVETYAGSQVDPLVAHPYSLATAGTHRLNVMIQLDDGSVSVKPYRYDIIDGSDLTLRDLRGRSVGATYSTGKRSFDLDLFYDIPSPPTMTGRILRNAEPFGTFQLNNNIVTRKMCSGNTSTFEFLSTDTLSYAIEVPFIYNVTTTVQAINTTEAKTNWPRIATLNAELAKFPDYTGLSPTDALRQFWQHSNLCYRDKDDLTGLVFGYWPRVLPRVGNALKGVLGNCVLWIATNATDWTANKPANPTEADTAIQADNNNVYTWWKTDGVGAWVLGVSKANAFFGLGREVVDTRGTGTWTIGLTNTVKQ